MTSLDLQRFTANTRRRGPIIAARVARFYRELWVDDVRIVVMLFLDFRERTVFIPSSSGLLLLADAEIGQPPFLAFREYRASVRRAKGWLKCPLHHASSVTTIDVFKEILDYHQRARLRIEAFRQCPPSKRYRLFSEAPLLYSI